MTVTGPDPETVDDDPGNPWAGDGDILGASRGVAPLRALLETTPANDILICTYTANLGFFTRAAAGRSRARGARVSIVSDAAQTSYDPELVRGAGSEWLDGRAWCNGAFHPKLIVVASDSHATVCVGSGNATPAGWVSNAELWVRFDAEPAAAPAAVAQVGMWLEGLLDADKQIHLGPGVVEAVRSAAKRLTAFTPAGLDAGAEVVSNLYAPILDSIPEGPVEELIVTSPFLDQPAEALRQVCHRLQPQALTVMVGADFRYDGAALGAVVAEHFGQVVRIADNRPYHGKLLEWSAGGRRRAMIGSPNVTRAALCRTVGEPDANCELAVICELTDTLAPPSGVTLSGGELAGHRYQRPISTSAPMLVGAMVDQEGTNLTLARSHAQELGVEAYDDATMTWVRVRIQNGGDLIHVTIPAGVAVHLVAGWRPAPGQPLRVRGASGAASAPYPATDAERLGPRRPSQANLPGHSDAFLDDPAFLDHLRDALMRLAADWRRNHPAGPGRIGTHPSGPAGPGQENPAGWTELTGDDPPASWQTKAIEHLRDECGQAFSEFVLPQFTGGAETWRPRHAIPEVRDEDNDDGEDPDQPQGDDRAVRRRARRKQDMRSWLNRHLDPMLQHADWKQARQASDGTCTLADVCIAAVVLAAWALGAFPDIDELVRSIERALWPLAWPAESTDLQSPAASAAAVGVWILDALAADDEAAVHRSGVMRPRARRLAVRLADRLADLNEAELEARCAGLATIERDRKGPDPYDVHEAALRAASPDSLAELADALGGAVTGRARVVTIPATLAGDGVPSVLRAWTALGVASPAAVRASTAQAGEILVAWAAPHLLIARQRPRRRANLYRLDAGLSTVAGSENGRPPGSAECVPGWYDRAQPPESAIAVLAACGTDLEAIP